MPFSGLQRLEPRAFGQIEEVTITLARKACFRNRLARMLRERVLEFSRDAFIQKNFHSMLLTTSALACSSAATALARVTVGKSSRNSSSVCPPSQIVQECLEGNPGSDENWRPPKIPGSLIMISLVSGTFLANSVPC